MEGRVLRFVTLDELSRLSPLEDGGNVTAGDRAIGQFANPLRIHRAPGIHDPRTVAGTAARLREPRTLLERTRRPGAGGDGARVRQRRVMLGPDAFAN